MNTVTKDSPNYAADWLKSESRIAGIYSRDQAVIAAGQGELVTGTVLASRTADGKFVVAAAGTDDGSEVAVAILFTQSVDTSVQDQPAVVIARQAVVSHQGLVYGPTLATPVLRAVAMRQLGAFGIVSREAA